MYPISVLMTSPMNIICISEMKRMRFLILISIVYCAIAINMVICQSCLKQHMSRLDGCLSDSEMATRALNVTEVTDPKECAKGCMRLIPCVAYSVRPDPTGGVTCFFYSDFTPSSSCADDGTKHYNLVNGKCGVNGIYNSTSGVCRCYNSYIGDHCDRLMTDCQEGYESGHYEGQRGIFNIWPATAPESFKIWCLMVARGRNYVQREITNKPNRTWHAYRHGFYENGFWLGLKNLHRLTNSRELDLVVTVYNRTTHNTILYRKFVVGGESENYSFNYQSVTENSYRYLGDCLGYLRGNGFSTHDADNDGNPDVNCAAVDGGGWWFGTNCSQCNLNGYIKREPPYQPGDAYWYPGVGEIYIKSTQLYLIAN